MEYHKSLEMSDLIGHTIKKAFIASQDVVLLITITGKRFYLSWTGDCCAKCFLAHVNNSEALIGATVLKVESTDWKSELTVNMAVYFEEDDEQQTMGTTFYTTKGIVIFETRLEHNGHDSGEIKIHNEFPLNQYDQAAVVEDYKLLKDF